jgi:hypothetical protein
MPLTHAQKTGLEAAILAYLTAQGGRFAELARAQFMADSVPKPA